MRLSPEQVKGRIKNIAKQNDADARILLRVYMMERFLERVAIMEKMITPMKIDISTGDVITPHAIEYKYQLMLENRIIRLRAYNLETILAEKIQTILSRGLLNTRMRDFYDIYVLLLLHEKDIDRKNIKNAFQATCEHRGTEELLQGGSSILDMVGKDAQLRTRWGAYQKKYLPH